MIKNNIFIESISKNFPPCLVLESDKSRCKISLHGGHVLSFVPAGSEDLLWVSSKALFETGTAIRGGIPVCWPWFGPHPADASKPSHGFARTSSWRIQETGMENGAPFAVLSLEADAASRLLFDYAFRLELRIVAGEHLRLALTTHNDDSRPFTITEALHTYFRVGDIREVTIEGVHGTDYIDQLQKNRKMFQNGKVTFEGEVDRIYGTTEGCLLRHGRKSLKIDKEGSGGTVVWNPWIEKAKRLTDFDDAEYTQMVCIETANTAAGPVTIKPGGRHTMSTVIAKEA